MFDARVELTIVANYFVDGQRMQENEFLAECLFCTKSQPGKGRKGLMHRQTRRGERRLKILSIAIFLDFLSHSP